MSCCPPPIVVNVPGVPGSPGVGSAGQNAFTFLTAPLVLPAANANVTAAVASSIWMAVGQNVIISDGTNVGNFQVISFPSVNGVVLKWLNYPNDSVTTTSIASSATVSPAGQLFTPANPIPVNQGGTGAATLTGLLLGNGVGAVTALSYQTGTMSALVAGAGSVSGITLTANSIIILSLKTKGGTVTFIPNLSATPTLGVGSGSFAVQGGASDTSVYSWLVIN